jgi:predicted amidohydrolase YtcJ
MSRSLLSAALGAALLATGSAAPGSVAASPAESAGPSDSSADLILTNGRIRGPAGVVQAMAVRRGVIVALGSDAGMANLRGPKTQQIDLGNSTVLPGLHDVHVHPLFAGLGRLACRVPQGSDLETLQDRLRACVQARDAGRWITGGQWDASALGRIPDRGMIDSIAPDHPVLLDDTSGHSGLANSRALRIAGVTRATPDPAGGIIERDANGEPTGVLRESAIDLVRRHVPAPDATQIREALAWSLREMLSYGITSFTEASVGFAAGLIPELEAYAALADSGTLKQRSRLCITWEPGSEAAEVAIAARNLYARSRLAPDCVKIFLDGVPTDSHTAAMLEPYAGRLAGRADEASRTGLLLQPQSVLDQAVTRFDAMGLTVKFHAAGDAAVRAGLNAIEAARKGNGYGGPPHEVGHCTFVAPEDIPRARAIGATFEVSPYLWGPTPINDDIAAAVGAPRIERVWPVREMIASGAIVVPGSDWAVVPSVSPWIGLETLVTRRKPGGSEQTFGEREAITLEQALRMYTEQAARTAGMAERVGRIEQGMLADVIVVDADPFAVPITAVHKIKVLMTFIAGERVYEALAK